MVVINSHKNINMSTEKINLDSPGYILDRALDEIISSNCKEIPYEGTEVDKEGIKRDILQYLKNNHYSLLKHNK